LRAVRARRRRAAARPRPERHRRSLRPRDPAPVGSRRSDGRGDVPAGALLGSYEAERGPIGRRNVAMSMAPAGGGSDDGLAEDLGSLVASAAIALEEAASTQQGAIAF